MFISAAGAEPARTLIELPTLTPPFLRPVVRGGQTPGPCWKKRRGPRRGHKFHPQTDVFMIPAQRELNRLTLTKLFIVPQPSHTPINLLDLANGIQIAKQCEQFLGDFSPITLAKMGNAWNQLLNVLSGHLSPGDRCTPLGSGVHRKVVDPMADCCGWSSRIYRRAGTL